MNSSVFVFWNPLLKASCYYSGKLPYFLGTKLKEGSTILRGWVARLPQVGSSDTPASRYKEVGAWQAKPVPEASDLLGGINLRVHKAPKDSAHS